MVRRAAPQTRLTPTPEWERPCGAERVDCFRNGPVAWRWLCAGERYG